MQKVKIIELFEELKKSRKNDIKSIQTIDKLEDEYKLLSSERMERLIIFILCKLMSALLAIIGTYKGIEANEIVGSISGTDQSGSFSFRPDIFGFAVLFFAAPYVYMLIRKFKGDKN